ncbi:hypothetical protein, partial [Paracoccus sp. SSK6]|uniref:hypothetical protein n=1 Tax=Paracoccus sp. SSK6 TaxID=3143131 RepID=UPI00321B6CCD
MLRKSMATFKFTGGVSAFKDKLVSGMVARGYDPDFAERTFRQLEGFGSYGSGCRSLASPALQRRMGSGPRSGSAAARRFGPLRGWGR